MTTTQSGFLAYFDKPKQTAPPAPAKTASKLSPYGRAVLDNQCPVMADAIEGTREATLMRLGRLIGGYIGGGEIPWDDGYNDLRDAALKTGLPEWEVDTKLSRHLEYGMREPLAAPNDWTPGKALTIPEIHPSGQPMLWRATDLKPSNDQNLWMSFGGAA